MQISLKREHISVLNPQMWIILCKYHNFIYDIVQNGTQIYCLPQAFDLLSMTLITPYYSLILTFHGCFICNSIWNICAGRMTFCLGPKKKKKWKNDFFTKKKKNFFLGWVSGNFFLVDNDPYRFRKKLIFFILLSQWI